MADSVVYYGYAAFYENKTSIDLSQNIINIGGSAFMRSKVPGYEVIDGIIKIVFPSSVCNIGHGAFGGMDFFINGIENNIQLDFSKATSLKTINSGAFAYKPNIVGNIKYPP